MRIKRFVIPCLLTALMLVLFTSTGFGRDKNNNAGIMKPVGLPVRSLLNVNLLALWAYADGISAHNPNTDGSGLIFPRGTFGAGVIYLDGLVLGGFVLDGRAPSLRTIGTTYRTSWRPGWMTAKGVAVDLDADDNRMYRIRPDFVKADLATDAAELVDGSVADVTAADEQNVRDQYLTDWQEWPVEVGAPFDDVGYLGADGLTTADSGNGTLDYGEDANMNGVLDDGEDANGNEKLDGETPGFAGADQVLWFACNDLDETRTQNLGGCPPIGLEMQVTLWGYNRTDALGNVAFKRFRIFYKGTLTTPNDAIVDSAYFAHFSDPDLGDYGDDFVGCDTDLDMMFVYNSVSNDQNFLPYNYPPPSCGYDFLQGPMVPGEAGDVAIYDMQLVPDMKNLGMTAFNYFAAGSPISDPDMGEYPGTVQWYNLMNGLTPRGEVPFTLNDGVTPTKFPLSGDPVAMTGELDGSVLPASDRRMQFITGPFELEYGTQQELVMAYVTGIGADRKSSVSVMKFNDIAAQYAYDNFFDLAKPPNAPAMEITALDGHAILNWGHDPTAVASTEGVVKKGFTFEGYNVYQMPTAASGLGDAKKLTTFDIVNELTTILDAQFDAVSGTILLLPSQTGKNTGIQRTLMVDKDAFTDEPLVNGTTYYFAVTAYSYNGDPTVPLHALESEVRIKSLIPQTEDPGTRYFHEDSESIDVTHVEGGTAIATAVVNVVDPTLVTGHDYKVWFNQQHYYSDANGVWKTAVEGEIAKLAKPGDLRPSTLTAAGVWSATTPGNIDINFGVNVSSPDWDYCDGIKLTFPAGITINSVDDDGTSHAIYDNVVMIGDSSVSTGGHFAGGETVSVNVSGATLPVTIAYTMYDDGWGFSYDYPDGIYNAYGTVTVDEVGNDFVSIYHWNLWDEDAAANVLEDQTILNGFDGPRVVNDVYYPGGENVGLNAVRIGDDFMLARVIDGLEISVTCGYESPSDFTSFSVYDGAELIGTAAPDNTVGGYTLYSFGVTGWGDFGPTATSADDLGPDYGTTELDLLQRDYEFRFTGVEDDPVAVGGLTYYPIQEGTGSLAILYRMRSGEIADHPDANNPGTGDPFFIRIPFEVWDMEDAGGPRQVMIVLLDRYQDPAAGGDFYPFNYDSRMYCNLLMEPYAEVIAGEAKDYIEYDGGTVGGSDKFTWNLVFEGMDWEKGDLIKLVYANPIVLGVDEFTFETEASILLNKELAKDDIKEVNVFPNPYYGVNSRETTESARYLTFNHLPARANFMIFDLAGNLVRKMVKDGENETDQYYQWDLRNMYDLPVASGIYIVHIEFPDLDKKVKILKVAVCREAQFVPIY